MNEWILAHPYLSMFTGTGGIMVFMLLTGNLRPVYRVVVFMLLGISVHLVLTKSPKEGANDFRTADTIRILVTNQRALRKWKQEAGSYPPAGAQGLSELKTYDSFVYFKDAWGRDIRYELIRGIPRMVSAGKDGRFDTEDDITR